MIIRVLPGLNNRSEWLSFFRREVSYCFVESPECLVDLQTTYLQLTLLHNSVRDGRQAVKYSLGSRTSLEPAWALVKACNWDLNAVIQGLNQLDFSSNVRDNSLLGVHTDLTVRKFFAKERNIVSPSTLSHLAPLVAPPQVWQLADACAALAHGQFEGLRAEGARKSMEPVDPPNAHRLVQQLVEQAPQWQVLAHKGRVYLIRQHTPLYSWVPKFEKPKPRLKAQAF